MNKVLIVGTAAKGGIASVIDSHIESGVYARGYERIVSHNDGGILYRLFLFAHALVKYVFSIFGEVTIHAHFSMRGSFFRKLLLLIIALVFRRKFFAHLHGSEFLDFYGSSSGFVKMLIKWFFRNSTKVIVLSDYWKTKIQDISPSADVVVLHNFVSPVLDYDKEFSATSNRFLYMGYVGKRKGIYDLIDAVLSIKDFAHANSIVFSCCGNGEVDLAKKYAEERGVSMYFDFKGWIGSDAKASMYASHDFFILPSHNEGQPMAVLEAMSAGMCILSTTVGAIPEVITDGVDGVLFPPGDISSLAESIQKVVVNRAESSRMGCLARLGYNQRHSPSAVLSDLNCLYK